MIAKLRRRHFVLVTAAVAVAAAGLASAALTRLPPERPATPPRELAEVAAPPLPPGAHLLWELPRLWETPPTIARLYAVVPEGPALLELQPLDSPVRRAATASAASPDTLLYWSQAGDSPADAWLLGAAPTGALRRYPLPEPARRGGGRLLLWSLGHHELLASAELPNAPAAPDADVESPPR